MAKASLLRRVRSLAKRFGRKEEDIVSAVRSTHKRRGASYDEAAETVAKRLEQTGTGAGRGKTGGSMAGLRHEEMRTTARAKGRARINQLHGQARRENQARRTTRQTSAGNTSGRKRRSGGTSKDDMLVSGAGSPSKEGPAIKLPGRTRRRRRAQAQKQARREKRRKEADSKVTPEESVERLENLGRTESKDGEGLFDPRSQVKKRRDSRRRNRQRLEGQDTSIFSRRDQPSAEDFASGRPERPGTQGAYRPKPPPGGRGRPYGALLAGAAGVGAMYMAGSYAANALGEQAFGEKEGGWGMLDMAGRSAVQMSGVHPMDRMTGQGVIDSLISADTAVMGAGAAAGMGIAGFALSGMETGEADIAPKDRMSKSVGRSSGSFAERTKQRGSSLFKGAREVAESEGLLGKSQAAGRMGGKTVRRGANWLQRKRMLKGAGVLMGAVAGASILSGAVNNLTRSVISQSPGAGRPKPYRSRATNRPSSATSSRVARFAGRPQGPADYSGVGATGDLVQSLHQNGGAGMVLR